jgi:hypothetical protein
MKLGAQVNPLKFLDAFPDQGATVDLLRGVRESFPTPEDIDDGQATAPSKRIVDLLPDYTKTVAGILIVKRIGLTVLRDECPHFNEWIEKIVRTLTPQ